MKVLTCNSNRPIAEAISAYLNLPLTSASVRRFSDMEVFVEINENVRGEDVFVIQSTSYPANDNLMELLVTLDALRRGSARRITAVIPYFGYARQDRKSSPRSPISAKLVANLITEAGADRVLTLDLHAGQIQGFFSIPVDNLYAQPLMFQHVKEHLLDDNTVIVSPDAGGVERARSFAKLLNCGLAIVDKRRSGPNEAEVMHIIGDVKGKRAVLIDDMIDTAGTLTKGAQAIQKHGAESVFAVATHPVLSGPAITRIEESVFTRVLVADTIQLRGAAADCKKLGVLSAKAINTALLQRGS